MVPFQEARDLVPVAFRAGGHTPMGKAVDLALDQLLARKQAYKEAGLEYYRPWLFVLTDGHPTDEEHFAAAAQRVREVEAQRGATVFAIGVGDACAFEMRDHERCALRCVTGLPLRNT